MISDPDLDISSLPEDVLDRLHYGLSNFDIYKCGLSLLLDDLPYATSEAARRVYLIESGYWVNELEPGYFDASIDTTFALYEKGRLCKGFLSGARTAPPYHARHLPWYLSLADLDEEQTNYINTCSQDSSFIQILKGER